MERLHTEVIEVNDWQLDHNNSSVDEAQDDLAYSKGETVLEFVLI